MRKVATLAILLAATAPAAVLAQDGTMAQGETMTQGETLSPDAGSGILTSQKSGETLSDSYVGADVVARAAEGYESVGKVSGLLFGPDDNIVGVVVDVGGFLGVAAKPVGLSWASLSEQQSEEGILLRTSLSREDFEAAPEFKTLEAQQRETTEEMGGSSMDGGSLVGESPPREPQ